VPRGRGHVVARVAAVATALVAALLVVLLAAACRAAPAAGASASAAPAPRPPARARGAARNVVTAEQWRGTHVTRIEELIAGRVAGVSVQRTLTGYSLRIRGVTTVLGETEPLVVLDGHPLPQGGRDLAYVAPADVERIEVLKDAGATAFYGMRGANGVLVITTKRPPGPPRWAAP
jgi:TonB-dependent SusC/RagA subfamily outer membrane receptor